VLHLNTQEFSVATSEPHKRQIAKRKLPKKLYVKMNKNKPNRFHPILQKLSNSLLCGTGLLHLVRGSHTPPQVRGRSVKPRSLHLLPDVHNDVLVHQDSCRQVGEFQRGDHSDTRRVSAATQKPPTSPD
jgi:hypothetical protein